MSNAKEKGKGGASKVAPNTNDEAGETKEVKPTESKEQVTLDYSKTYTVISLVTTKHLKEEKEYNVAGKLAEKMINNNQAKLKN